MTKSWFIGVFALAFVVSCQFPLTPAGSGRTGVNFTLTLTQPSVSAPRLLLANASDITLTVVADGITVDQKTVPRTGSTVQVEFSLVPLKTYTITAQAKDKDGKLLFSGSTTVTLTSNQKATLNLLPAPAAAANLAAADQPAGGTLAGVAALAAGAMATYQVDFGSTATELTFAAAPAGVDLYLQTTDGTNLPALAADRVLKKTSLASGTSVLATYFNPGVSASAAIPSLGTFKIPFASLTLTAGPTAVLGTGDTLALAVTMVPANATDAALSWTSSAPALASVDAGTGLVTALLPGTATVTGTTTAPDRTPVSVSIDLTLNPTQYLIASTPAAAVPAVPVPTLALAGNAGQLWALGTDRSVRGFSAGLWEAVPTVQAVPSATVKWLAADNAGTLYAGSPTEMYSFDGTGSWTLVTAPPAATDGLASAGGVVWASATGFLWSWQSGVWQKGPALPPGFLALGGGEVLTALAGTQTFTFNGSTWEAGPPAPAQAAALTSAYQSLLILVVR